MISAITVYALWKVRAGISDWKPSEPRLATAMPVVALGAFFVLELLFLQNVAYIASSSMTSMEIALAVVFIGNAIGFGVLGQISQQGLIVRLIAGVVLVVVAVLLPIATGVVVIASVLVGQSIAAGLLTGALNSFAAPTTNPSIGRTSVVVGLGSLLFTILSILYYISALISLPFSSRALPAVAAVVILLIALVPSKRDEVPQWQLAIFPLVCLLIPLLLFVTRPLTSLKSTPSTSFRLMDYNIHSAITFDGWIDPEGIARVIESQHPDILTLQECTRGWLIAGSLDIAEWLSRRLEMPYIYAPAHDYQFGNILLTRMPITEWSFTRLPVRNAPMGRSFIQAKIDLGNGKSMMVINTHLSAYTTTEGRIPEVQKVIETWNRSPRTLVVGDMNAVPGDVDMALYLNAGLVSAQDVAGNPNQFTSTSAKPVKRIDWIFGSPDIAFSDFTISSTTASDHLPVIVTVTIP